MTLWGVRSGKYGEREALGLDNGLAVIGCEEMPDLAAFADRESLRRQLATTYPDEKPKTLMNWESQLWPSARVMAVDDPVVMPLKQRSGFALGRVSGSYTHAEHGGEWLHTRPVERIKEVPRTALAQDFQHSFGAFLTIFQVYRNEAEQRVKAVSASKECPEWFAPPKVPTAYGLPE